MKKIVIIGADGQLGTDLPLALSSFHVTPLTIRDVDVRNWEQLQTLLTDLRPGAVVNTSAFHQVDICEDDPETSFAVNATGAYNLARLAASLDFTLVHFSSDYVFDGKSRSPYREDDLPNPINVYGASKLAGEFLVRNYCPRHFIIRTTGLYGAAGAMGKGGNFVETMVRLGRSGKPLRVVDDQVISPTATVDLAAAIASLLEKDGQLPYGIYHVTGAGQCSWYDFAAKIFELCNMAVDLSPQTTAQAGNKARRPAYSVLSHDRWIAAGLKELRPWPEALAEYLITKGHRPR